MDKSKKRTLGVLAAAVLAAALVAVLVVGLQGGPREEAPAAAGAARVSVIVHCDGWDAETSTPIVASAFQGDVREALASTEEGAVVPEPVQTVTAKAGQEVVFDQVTQSGTYTVCVVGSPVLSDGTVFQVPDPVVVEFDAQAPSGEPVSFDLVKKDAADVTEADLVAAEAAAQKAGADASAVGQARQEASSAQGGSVRPGSVTAVVSAPAAPSAPSSSGGTGQAQASQPAAPSAPACSHDWVPVTQTVRHDAVYRTVSHPAVTRDVVVCNACGARDVDRDHMEQHALNDEDASCHVETVVVQKAWDEQVLVSEAWDEEVTVGYRCSGCGATR